MSAWEVIKWLVYPPQIRMIEMEEKLQHLSRQRAMVQRHRDAMRVRRDRWRK